MLAQGTFLRISTLVLALSTAMLAPACVTAPEAGEAGADELLDADEAPDLAPATTARCCRVVRDHEMDRCYDLYLDIDVAFETCKAGVNAAWETCLANATIGFSNEKCDAYPGLHQPPEPVLHTSVSAGDDGGGQDFSDLDYSLIGSGGDEEEGTPLPPPPQSGPSCEENYLHCMFVGCAKANSSSEYDQCLTTCYAIYHFCITDGRGIFFE